MFILDRMNKWLIVGLLLATIQKFENVKTEPNLALIIRKKILALPIN